MKPKNHKLVLALAVFAVTQLTVCSKKSDLAEIGASYRSFDGKKTITVTAVDELEMGEHGANLICKYTKQDGNTLRVVANIMGTTQALYYRIIPQGLQAKDGTVLFSAAGYAQENESQEKERKRVSTLLEQSRKASVEIAKYGLTANSALPYDYFYLTDVSVKMHKSARNNERFDAKNEFNEVFFGDITKIDPLSIFSVGESQRYYFRLYWRYTLKEFPDGREFPGDHIINSDDLPEVKSFHESLINAYRAWGNKFSEFKKTR